MINRVFRVKPDGELEHLGDDIIEGWEPPPLRGSQLAERGEVIWVENIRCKWTSDDRLLFIREIVVK